MHFNRHSLLFRSYLLIIVILTSGLLLTANIVNQMLEAHFNEEATRHISILANGSIDDLLAKDYGDMESWVKATASHDAYAFAFIQSPSGKILIHSDLGYAGMQKKPINTTIPLYLRIHYEDQPATEIIYPILIEDTLLGTAHLAYYNQYRNSLIKSTLTQLAVLFVALLLIMLTGLYLLIRRHPSSNSG